MGCGVCVTPQLFLTVYPHANVGPHTLPATAWPTLVLQLLPCCKCSPSWLPVSTPPTSLGECFFFNSLVVRPPYSSIFCQFLLFLFLNLLSFFWLCKEAKCIYLCLYLGWKSLSPAFNCSLLHTPHLLIFIMADSVFVQDSLSSFWNEVACK